MKRLHALACVTSVCVGIASFAVAQQIGSVRDVYDGNLPLAVEVETFRHIDRVFPSATIAHGTGRAFPLPANAAHLADVVFAAGGRPLHLADYKRLNRVAGLLVLKDGRIALEKYNFGNNAQTRWVSFSVVKSI